jgi:hypothetical protein
MFAQVTAITKGDLTSDVGEPLFAGRALISFRGGRERTGQVGACHRSECRFNDQLECTAASVRIGAGADVADCLTYEAR